jgi:DNA helicase-2/ATP-dependent DNA helicase PcrA
MTRAMGSLYLTYATNRRRYNSYLSNEPSVFLDEIPQELIEYRYATARSKRAPRQSRRSARREKIEAYFNTDHSQSNGDDEFHVGQPVYHATFGKGQIVKLEGHGDKTKITVRFFNGNIEKKLIKQFANLSPIEN